MTAEWAGGKYLVAETVACSEQQQGLFLQTLRRDLFRFNPGMRCRQNHPEWLIIELLDDNAGFVKRQRDNGDVDVSAFEGFREPGRIIFLDDQRHSRRARREQRNERR